MEVTDPAALARTLGLLAHERRLELVLRFDRDWQAPGAIQAATGITRGPLAWHLRLLCLGGLIETRRRPVGYRISAAGQAIQPVLRRLTGEGQP